MESFEESYQDKNLTENSSSRLLSPNLSISQLEKSGFSFGGLLELDKLITQMKTADDVSSKEEDFALYDESYEIYIKKTKEIEEQIKIIQKLYEKEQAGHQKEKRNFEKIVKNLKNSKENEFLNKIKKTHISQTTTIKNIIRDVINLQNLIL